ncbi:MAG: acylneuraminate cytidylyltransferase [Anaerolineaceae bacterium]|nr:acylneuraminate cytidylyltransferase [Anaerolineaceae bacterium]
MDSLVNKPEVLAIIPARGGSKGIPGKNIRCFAGYPLIAYSIAAAQQSEYVTRVIVSTDDEKIAELARQFGAETPFMRPSEFAEDNSLDFPVFEHALLWLKENENYSPDIVVQLRPTSPIRPPTCVDDAIKVLLQYPQADSVRGIVPSGQNPHKMWRLDAATGQMQNLLDVSGVAEPYNAPRQILPPVYWQTGHIDAIRSSTILDKKSMSGNVIMPLILDSRYTVDIDNLYDWDRYEHLFYEGGLEMVEPGPQRRPFPKNVKLLVLDFDGVLTDNRVWVDGEGHEFVAANRSDSMGIRVLMKKGVDVFVLSTEVNSVVAARCKKMNVPVMHGIEEKAEVLTAVLKERNIEPDEAIYVGNDINDLPCFPVVGYAIAVPDAMPEVLQAADFVLNATGGHGAVREICDLILRRKNKEYK